MAAVGDGLTVQICQHRLEEAFKYYRLTPLYQFYSEILSSLTLKIPSSTQLHGRVQGVMNMKLAGILSPKEMEKVGQLFSDCISGNSVSGIGVGDVFGDVQLANLYPIESRRLRCTLVGSREIFLLSEEGTVLLRQHSAVIDSFLKGSDSNAFEMPIHNTGDIRYIIEFLREGFDEVVLKKIDVSDTSYKVKENFVLLDLLGTLKIINTPQVKRELIEFILKEYEKLRDDGGLYRDTLKTFETFLEFCTLVEEENVDTKVRLGAIMSDYLKLYEYQTVYGEQSTKEYIVRWKKCFQKVIEIVKKEKVVLKPLDMSVQCWAGQETVDALNPIAPYIGELAFIKDFVHEISFFELVRKCVNLKSLTIGARWCSPEILNTLFAIVVDIPTLTSLTFTVETGEEDKEEFDFSILSCKQWKSLSIAVDSKNCRKGESKFLYSGLVKTKRFELINRGYATDPKLMLKYFVTNELEHLELGGVSFESCSDRVIGLPNLHTFVLRDQEVSLASMHRLIEKCPKLKVLMFDLDSDLEVDVPTTLPAEPLEYLRVTYRTEGKPATWVKGLFQTLPKSKGLQITHLESFFNEPLTDSGLEFLYLDTFTSPTFLRELSKIPTLRTLVIKSEVDKNKLESIVRELPQVTTLVYFNNRYCSYQSIDPSKFPKIQLVADEHLIADDDRGFDHFMETHKGKKRPSSDVFRGLEKRKRVRKDLQ